MCKFLDDITLQGMEAQLNCMAGQKISLEYEQARLVRFVPSFNEKNKPNTPNFLKFLMKY